jgi:hypothetical protein
MAARYCFSSKAAVAYSPSPARSVHSDPASSEPDRLAYLDVPSTTTSLVDRQSDALRDPVKLTAFTRSERLGAGG